MSSDTTPTPRSIRSAYLDTCRRNGVPVVWAEAAYRSFLETCRRELTYRGGFNLIGVVRIEVQAYMREYINPNTLVKEGPLLHIRAHASLSGAMKRLIRSTHRP